MIEDFPVAMTVLCTGVFHERLYWKLVPFSLYNATSWKVWKSHFLNCMKETSFSHSDLRHEETPALWSDFYILLKFKCIIGDSFAVKIWVGMDG